MTKGAPSGTTNSQPFGWRMRLRIRLAQAILLFERMWPAAWPGLSLIFFYLAISLFDPWFYLPYWVQPLTLAVVLIGSYLLLRKAALHTHVPDISEARRRLEHSLVDSFANARPLDMIQDQPTTGTSRDGGMLWQAQQYKLRAILGSMRVHAPRAGLQYADPFGLRLLLLFVALFGLYSAGADWQARTLNALRFHLNDGGRFAVIDLWVSPPEYTGAPDIMLARASSLGALRQSSVNHGALDIPEGSTISARVSGTSQAPRLVVSDNKVLLTENGETAFSGEATVQNTNVITLELGGSSRVSWPVHIIEDQPPEIRFRETPEQTARHALTVKYDWADDYGLAQARLSLRRPGSIDDNQYFDLDATRGSNSAEQTRYLDLTAHPWAGSTVFARLLATDGGGNQGQSTELQFILPEREFTHPVARNLISIRKSLFVDGSNLTAPRRRLELIANRPQDYNNDLVVFAAIQSAYWRLGLGHNRAETNSVTEILWQTALRLEDGDLSQSEAALRQSMDELMRALEDGLDGDSIEALTQQLAQAMADMLRSAMQQSGFSETDPSALSGGNISAQSLSQLINQIRELAATGQTEEAMELLAELQDVMENLRVERTGPEDYERIMEGSKAMNALDSIMREQERLQGQTQRMNILNQLLSPDGGSDGSRLKSLSDLQRGLSEALEEVTRTMEEHGLGGAKELSSTGLSMENAAEALDNNRAAQSLPHQQEALDSMQDTMNNLGQQLSEQISRMQSAGQGSDPLGRAGATTGESIKLPDESEMVKAREILDELRARLNDPSRSKEERDYLKRLLERFRGS